VRNQHAADCYQCGKTVKPGKGYVERYNGSWLVQHVECCHKARKEKIAAIQARFEK
jgi:ribosomal protein L24E